MSNKFTQAHRLRKADEFSSVFVFRKVRVGKFFKLHYKPNELSNSRLGFMVSKKIHKRANQRNYIKRTIREFFRIEQSDWMPLDLIVRAQKHFTPEHYPLIIAELKQLCTKFKLNSNVQKTSNSAGS